MKKQNESSSYEEKYLASKRTLTLTAEEWWGIRDALITAMSKEQIDSDFWMRDAKGSTDPDKSRHFAEYHAELAKKYEVLINAVWSVL